MNGTTGSAILCKRLTSSLYTVNNKYVRDGIHPVIINVIILKYVTVCPNVCALFGFSFSTSASPNAKAQKGEQLSPFWKKNVELKRPVSPHLQVYAPQLTSMLSITNRITGIATGVGQHHLH